MRHSNFLRKQAEQCIALSRATIDLTVAGRLRAMAADLRAKAAEWDDEEGHPLTRPNGCGAGGDLRRN
jgi:hypothetical protein